MDGALVRLAAPIADFRNRLSEAVRGFRQTKLLFRPAAANRSRATGGGFLGRARARV